MAGGWHRPGEAAGSQPYAQRPAPAAVLDYLPVATLVLATDGAVMWANQAWTELSGLPAGQARDNGWLEALEPSERLTILAQVQHAAADRIPGSANVRMAAGAKMTRWQWQPCLDGRLVICATGAGADHESEDPPSGDDLPAHGLAPVQLGTVTDIAHMVVHRLFGIGLTIQSAAGLAGPAGLSRLERAVGELDTLISDVRAAAFGSRPSPG